MLAWSLFFAPLEDLARELAVGVGARRGGGVGGDRLSGDRRLRELDGAPDDGVEHVVAERLDDAFEHLAPGTACAGKAYFISNGEPWPMRDVLNGLLRAAGAPEVHKHLPFGVAYAVGVACEGLWTVLPLKGEPPMTRFLAEQLSTSHWYSMAPATRDFGYVPKVTMADGLERLRSSIRS